MKRGRATAHVTTLMAVLILVFVSVCYANEEQDITSEAVIRQTNQERAERNIPALQANRILNTAARVRLDDMLAKGYFGHTSPSGEGVPEIAETLHYDYRQIGENLARGNFKGVEDLMGFWLKSTQHRKNLLSRDYKDIGVAVARERVDGRDFWHAVQVFGKRTRAASEP